MCANPVQSGPMDATKHSNLPYFLRMRGSVMPKMILPMVFVAGWATMITVISKTTHNRECEAILKQGEFTDAS